MIRLEKGVTEMRTNRDGKRVVASTSNKLVKRQETDDDILYELITE